jgi:hypothetical protein
MLKGELFHQGASISVAMRIGHAIFTETCLQVVAHGLMIALLHTTLWAVPASCRDWSTSAFETMCVMTTRHRANGVKKKFPSPALNGFPACLLLRVQRGDRIGLASISRFRGQSRFDAMRQLACMTTRNRERTLLCSHLLLYLAVQETGFHNIRASFCSTGLRFGSF